MAIEDIFRALEEQADRDVEAVLGEARQHADAILDEAKRDADRTHEQRVAEAERIAKIRSAQGLNHARLEARKRVAAAKERAVSDAFTEARARLATVRGRDDYPTLFRALLSEALEGVTGEFEVVVDPADQGLASKVLADLGVQAAVRADTPMSGGVILSSRGDRVLRRNTLEDRLEKFEGIAQADVAEILFT